MRVASRLTLMAIVGGIACGDSSSPVVPQTMIGLPAGNGQSAPTGATLPIPLGVIVTGSDGRPFRGATVTWAVTPAGAASLAPATATTDSIGTASTTVTLGGQIGAVGIQASVPNVPPVNFTVTATDPCDYLASYTLGATVNGSLATTDCNFGGYYTDFYRLDLPSAQQGLAISMSSPTFDTWVDLYSFSSGAYLAFDDDISSGNTNSLLEAIVAPGSYVVAPNSFDAGVTGSYSLTVSTRPQTLAGCVLVWLTRGVTVSDNVMTNDCVDTSGAYFDVVALWLEAGSVLTVAERSTAVNALLELYDASLNLLAANDDSAATTTDAYLAYTIPATAPYVVFISTSVAGQTGAYTLAVSASTTLSQVSALPGLPRLQLAPRRAAKGEAWRVPLPRARRCC